MKANIFSLLIGTLLLASCSTEKTEEGDAATIETAASSGQEFAFDAVKLEQVLNAQPETSQARYLYRHPKETLEFFGIAPGMTVVEVLPSGGWYSKILLPYLGADGKLIGADYSIPMWREFGGFADAEFLKRKESWITDWTADAAMWRGDGGADVSAFVFGVLPPDMHETADAVLLFRALHHFNRFERKGGYFTTALSDIMAVLKPGGVVGVVQHQAPEGHSDDWANGDHGYLKKSLVIKKFEGAGFELVGESAVNANPQDQPSEDNVVWRLPPTLATSRNDDDLRARMKEVGESNRMTLLFRKPF